MAVAERGVRSTSRIDLDAFWEGGETAMRAVLREHGPLIRSVVAGCAKSRADAEDLYQEVVVAIWERRAAYSAKGSLRAWVNRVARNVCHGWFRQEARDRKKMAEFRRLMTTERGLAPMIEDPSRLAEEAEFMHALRAAIAQLPPKQEAAFTLLHVEGLSARDVADRTGMSEATVRSNARHARLRLRKLMEDSR